MRKSALWMGFATSCWLAGGAGSAVAAGSGAWTVTSPDKTLQVDLRRAASPRGSAGDSLQYRVRRAGDLAVDWSPLGIRFGDTDFGPGLRVIAVSSAPYADDYRLAHGKASAISVRANRLTLDATNTTGARIRLLLHVQNDGVGFRYEIPRQSGLPESATVTEEHTGFRIPKGGPAGWVSRTDASAVAIRLADLPVAPQTPYSAWSRARRSGGRP